MTVPPSPATSTFGPEALGVQPVGGAVRVPVLLEASSIPAGRRPRSRARPVGDQLGRGRPASSMPSASVCRSTSRISPAASQLAQLGAEDHVVGGGRAVQHDDVVRLRARSRRAASTPEWWRSMPITGVMPLPAVTNRSRPGLGRGRTKSPVAWSSWISVPGLALADQVVADLAVGDRLDGDADPAVGARAGGQGVGAPQADAVDVDADAHVLAGHVAGPAAPGLISTVAASAVSG